jgi:hypothetical protein
MVIESYYERGRKERIHLAWLTSSLMRQKKIPELDKLINKPKPLTKEDTETLIDAGKKAEQILRDLNA